MFTKQQLGNTLWGMADILYDKVEGYKTYILSLLFFKCLSDNWTWEIDNKVREHIITCGKKPNEKHRATIAAEAHDFVIPEGCFWNNIKNASANEKNEKIDAAVKAIAEANPPLLGIISAVQWNAPPRMAQAASACIPRYRLDTRLLDISLCFDGLKNLR
jgi:type I restriction enzyme M protein